MGEIQQVRASKPLMDLLIIDDTFFVGRHPACAALAHSDCITLFNRAARRPRRLPQFRSA